MRIIRNSVFFLFVPLAAFSQMENRNTLTIGAGGAFPASGFRTDQFSNGPSFAVSYEYRLFRFLAPEAGLVNLLPNYTNYSQHGSSVSRERVTMLSIGIKGILPLANDRFEFFAGPSAVRVWSSEAELTNSYHAPTWLLGTNAGARMAIGHGRRFWLGPTMRYSRDGGRPTEQWVSLTGDFGFRF